MGECNERRLQLRRYLSVDFDSTLVVMNSFRKFFCSKIREVHMYILLISITMMLFKITMQYYKHLIHHASTAYTQWW